MCYRIAVEPSKSLLIRFSCQPPQFNLVKGVHQDLGNHNQKQSWEKTTTIVTNLRFKWWQISMLWAKDQGDKLARVWKPAGQIMAPWILCLVIMKKRKSQTGNRTGFSWWVCQIWLLRGLCKTNHKGLIINDPIVYNTGEFNEAISFLSLTSLGTFS